MASPFDDDGNEVDDEAVELSRPRRTGATSAREPAEEPRASEVVKKLADPVLLGLEARYTRVRTLPITVELVLREPADHVTPESWRIYPPELHERTIWNADLHNDLHQVTPQALLRDLHRPVRNEPRSYLEPVSGQAEPSPWTSFAPALDVMKREPLPELRASTLLMAESDDARRYYYREDWKPAKGDDEPRTVFSTSPMFEDWGQEAE